MVWGDVRVPEFGLELVVMGFGLSSGVVGLSSVDASLNLRRGGASLLVVLACGGGVACRGGVGGFVRGC